MQPVKDGNMNTGVNIVTKHIGAMPMIVEYLVQSWRMGSGGYVSPCPFSRQRENVYFFGSYGKYAPRL